MPATSRQLQLPQPCHERWDAMTPATAGRHCAACAQVVVDFTRMSDRKLVAFLARHPGTTCGRFRQHQLARPLPPPQLTGWARWLAATAALLGLGTLVAPGAHGQPRYGAGPAPASVTPAAASPVAVGASAEAPAPPAPANAAIPVEAGDGFVLIKGQLLTPGGAPKAGAEVLVSCYSLLPDTTVMTDAAGRFQVAIPRDSLREGAELSAASFPKIGFTYQYASAAIASTPAPFYQLQLQRKRKRRMHTMGKFR